MPAVSGAFVAAREDVLELDAEPYAPQRPKVCFDETTRQLLADLHSPLPAQPGRPRRQDYTYKRQDTPNLFIHCEGQTGWRHGEVTARRTLQDFAHQRKWLVDERSPPAAKIRVILDKLNPHGPGSLSDAFAPAAARRLVEKLEFHHTPKQGSWLNRADSELSLLQRQGLARRSAEEATLKQEVAAWEALRNQAQATINWRFSIPEAREKLQRLYPSPLVR